MKKIRPLEMFQVAILIALASSLATHLFVLPGWGAELVKAGVERQAIKIHGPASPADCEIEVSEIDLRRELPGTANTNYIFVVFDAGTGFFWWEHEYADPSAVIGWITNQLWLAPEVGIASVAAGSGVLRAHLSTARAKTLAEARAAAFGQLNDRFHEKPTPDFVEYRALMRSFIGEDFYKQPGADNAFQSKVLSVAYAKGLWRIQIESKRIDSKAVIELDRNFVVQKAWRDGAQVYPKETTK